MIVTCESCRTKFRLDPSRLKGSKNKVRCSRCKHVFLVAKEEEKDKVFINLDEPEDAGMMEEHLAPPPPPPERETLLPPRTKSKPGTRRILLWAVPLVVVVLAVLVVIYYYVLPSSENPPPEKTAVPKVEEAAVTISGTTQAYFIENSHSGQLFVVEGEIINEGTKPVSFTLVEGKLYTTDSKIVQSQKCFAGNPMTREELTVLAINEIQNRMMNREGKDMANVNVLPHGHVRFTVVFHNLPEVEVLSDYSVEVLNSRGQ